MLPKFSILYIYIFVSFQWASILGSLDLGTLKLVQVVSPLFLAFPNNENNERVTNFKISLFFKVISAW